MLCEAKMRISSKPDSIQTVTKLDAARRQLDSAISLYFREIDPIAVHTLACAAHQIIHDINYHRKGPKLLYDSLKFKDECRGLAKKQLNQHYNFFKHADKDPDPEGEIEFNPKGTELFIIMAIIGLQQLESSISCYCSAFFAYFAVHNTHLLTQEGIEFYFNSIPIDEIKVYRTVKRSEFFDIFLRANR